jgi:hypothetical protein
MTGDTNVPSCNPGSNGGTTAAQCYQVNAPVSRSRCLLSTGKCAAGEIYVQRASGAACEVPCTP